MCDDIWSGRDVSFNLFQVIYRAGFVIHTDDGLGPVNKVMALDDSAGAALMALRRSEFHGTDFPGGHIS